MKLCPDLLDRLVKGKSLGCSSLLVARNLGVSKRRVDQLWCEYVLTGVVPVLERVGRKRVPVSDEIISVVIKAKLEFGFGARVLERLIRERYKLSVPHNKIHRVLKLNGLASACARKQKRRKWVRYEREHSLTAAHMDWYEDSITHKHVCILIDDASRKILSAGEFDNATSENSILLVEQALKEYEFIDEIITDHGTQFYAVNKGINEFQKYLVSKGIKHILCMVKHPQSNGKAEIWFKNYKRFRQNFKTFQELINWYNNVRPHESLEHDILLTPSEAFTLKQKPETLMKQATQMLNEDKK